MSVVTRPAVSDEALGRFRAKYGAGLSVAETQQLASLIPETMGTGSMLNPDIVKKLTDAMSLPSDTLPEQWARKDAMLQAMPEPLLPVLGTAPSMEQVEAMAAYLLVVGREFADFLLFVVAKAAAIRPPTF